MKSCRQSAHFELVLVNFHSCIVFSSASIWYSVSSTCKPLIATPTTVTFMSLQLLTTSNPRAAPISSITNVHIYHVTHACAETLSTDSTMVVFSSSTFAMMDEEDRTPSVVVVIIRYIRRRLRRISRSTNYHFVSVAVLSCVSFLHP